MALQRLPFFSAKEKRDKLKSSFTSKMDECQSRKDRDVEVPSRAEAERKADISVVKEPNPNYPAFHKAIKVRYEEGKKRQKEMETLLTL